MSGSLMVPFNLSTGETTNDWKNVNSLPMFVEDKQDNAKIGLKPTSCLHLKETCL